MRMTYKLRSAFLTYALFPLRSPVLLTAASLHLLVRQQGSQATKCLQMVVTVC